MVPSRPKVFFTSSDMATCMALNALRSSSLGMME